MATAAPPQTDTRAAVLYDGECPLCQKSVRILRKLDWLGRLRFADARKPDQWPDAEVQVDPGAALKEMHLVTPDGKRAYAGFYAFRWAAGRTPALWLLYPLLFLPGVPRLGRRAYAWVARNRFKLVSCHDGQCQLPRK